MIRRYAIALSLVLLLACSAQPAHASLSTDTTRVVYAGSGSTGPFPVTFPFTADADLLVIKTDTPAYITSTVLALNTDYTVTGAGGTGGTVMLTSTLTSAYTLVIMRASDFLQSSAFGEHQPFHAASIEAILDKHTKELQELQDKVDRSLRVSPANSGTYSLEMAKPIPSYVLGWDSTGKVITQYPSSGGTGGGGNTGGFFYWIHDYGDNLTTALSGLGSNRATLLIDRAVTVSADTVVPATLELLILNGGSLDIASGKTVTINSKPNVGYQQWINVASGTGTVTFGAGSVADVYAEWWQTNTPGTMDMTAAVNAAVQAAPEGATLRGLVTSYLLKGSGTELVLIDKKVHIKGVGSKDTVYVVDESVDNSTSVFRFHKDGAYEVREHIFSDFGIRGSNYFTTPFQIKGPGKHGIEIDAKDTGQTYMYSTISRVKMWPVGDRSIYIDVGDTDGYNMSNIEHCNLANGITMIGVTDGNQIKHNAIQGPGYGINITQPYHSMHMVIENNDIIAGGAILIEGGLSGIIQNNGLEPHYAFTDAAAPVIKMAGNATKLWNWVIRDNAINIQPKDIVGWGGLGAKVGIWVDNATETKIESNYLGISTGVGAGHSLAIVITPNATRTMIDPKNTAADQDLFATVNQLLFWEAHSGRTFKTESDQPVAVFRDGTEMVEGGSVAALEENEWYWESGYIYVKEDSGTIETVTGLRHLSPWVFMAQFRQHVFIQNSGVQTKGLQYGFYLVNGWIPSNGYSYPTAYKDIDGRVRIDGSIKDGNYTNGSEIFTLPLGYRPKYNIYVQVPSYEKNVGWRDVILQIVRADSYGAGRVNIADSLDNSTTVMMLNDIQFTPADR